MDKSNYAPDSAADESSTQQMREKNDLSANLLKRLESSIRRLEKLVGGQDGMKIKTTRKHGRGGYIFKDKQTGKWYARVTYTDATGRRRNVKRSANDEDEANRVLKEINNSLQKKVDEATQDKPRQDEPRQTDSILFNRSCEKIFCLQSQASRVQR